MLKRYPEPFLASYVCDALDMPVNVVFAVEFVNTSLTVQDVHMCLHNPVTQHARWGDPGLCYPEGEWTLCQNYGATLHTMHVDASYSSGKSGGYW